MSGVERHEGGCGKTGAYHEWLCVRVRPNLLQFEAPGLLTGYLVVLLAAPSPFALVSRPNLPDSGFYLSCPKPPGCGSRLCCPMLSACGCNL